MHHSNSKKFMLQQTGSFATAHASKYLQQLCKHFAHKVSATYDDTRGDVEFPFGPAQLLADDHALRVVLQGADDAALERARSVIDVHLKTFAFREDFTALDWQPTSPAPND